jgi:uncharacterized protein YjbI with pentapeptide repeats
MKEPTGIVVKKPISVLNKALKLDFKEFFKSLGKAAVLGFAGDWKGAGTNAIDAISSIDIGKNWEDYAWLLIYRSLSRAIFNLIQEDDLIRQKPDDPEMLCQQLDLSLENLEIALDNHFFDGPKELRIVESIKKPFFQWLCKLGLNEAEAQAIVNRFPSYFVFALNEEWRKRSEDYILLKEKLETPFIRATEKERGWLQYSAWLQKHVDERMFEELFSLREIYVPLRAYYEEDITEEGGKRLYPDETQCKRVVVNLEQQLENWILKADKNDAIRVISGGPGYGKSSFAKMLAARQAEKGEIPILFIPLHLFEITADLVEAVSDFAQKYQFLTHNPLEPESQFGDTRLFIIFDGLDELSMQGKIGLEICQRFCQEVIKLIYRFNQTKTRLQVLITGRELVVQDNVSQFRKPQQVLHLLPYYLSEESRKAFIDNQRLLEIDQRDMWWKFYGGITGKGYQGMPPELKSDKLEEITSQPLLNYLVALGHERGEIDFLKETNMNRIYEALISAVYDRGWAVPKKYLALEEVSKADFFRILEAIGILAWHGDGRTTTENEIETYCQNRGLSHIFEKFKEGASKGVTRLLTAFYFRQAGLRSGGEKTFEFTNKSFGEYLISRRIIQSLRILHEELERRRTNPDSIWDERETLKFWAEICGPTAINENLFIFILEEIKLQDVAEVNKWQETICKLIAFMLRFGMPMEKLDPRPSFHKENIRARNSEEALLAVLNACAKKTKKVSQINWPSDTALGSWIASLQGQRTSSRSELALKCLSFMNLSKCVLTARDLVSSDLSYSILDEAGLAMVSLEGANLENVKIRGAMLRNSNLMGANLKGADLQDSWLMMCNLTKANLEGANLINVDLEGANLEGANFTNANLEGANLRNTILK